MKAWIARDKDKSLFLFFGTNPPMKNKENEIWKTSDGKASRISSSEFPLVQWEDEEPLEVSIVTIVPNTKDKGKVEIDEAICSKPSTVQYEYKSIILPDCASSTFIKFLNDEGENGWELVIRTECTYGFECILKRVKV